MQNFLEKIQKRQSAFSPAVRKVATYIMEHYSDIPFCTITDVATAAGVSVTSVIKFCTEMQYSAFSEFKQAMRDHIQQTLISHYNINDDNFTEAHQQSVLDEVTRLDIENIHRTMNNPINQENIKKFFHLAEKAHIIYTMGFRTSAIFATYTSLLLRMQGLTVFPITPGIGDYIDKMLTVHSDDLVMAFSFNRYSKDVVKMLKTLHDRKIPIVLVTDDKLSPSYVYADLVFTCSTRTQNYVASYVGCMSLLNSIFAYGISHYKNYVKSLSQLEQFYSDYEPFYEP